MRRFLNSTLTICFFLSAANVWARSAEGREEYQACVATGVDLIICDAKMVQREAREELARGEKLSREMKVWLKKDEGRRYQPIKYESHEEYLRRIKEQALADYEIEKQGRRKDRLVRVLEHLCANDRRLCN